MSEQTLLTTGRAWHLEARPVGRPTPLEFALREVSIAPPGPGQILVANEFAPLSAYLGVLGLPGLTAYIGLKRRKMVVRL